MKAFLLTFLASGCLLTAHGQDRGRDEALELRVKRLEQQVAMMRSELASLSQRAASPAVIKQQDRAHARAQEDGKHYSSADLRKAEALYLLASRAYGTDESKPLLDSVVQTYPLANRAGCAQLYLAQYAEGAEQERLLKDCIKRFADCYYMDGVQVGPLAMMQLASAYRKAGRTDEAEKLHARIRKDFSDAVAHDGQLLVERMSD